MRDCEKNIILKIIQNTGILCSHDHHEIHHLNGLEKYCQRVLVVDVPVETQLKRASSRDTVSINQIQSIIDSQIDRTSRLSKADDVIDNSADLTHLYKQVTKLHNKYLTLAVG